MISASGVPRVSVIIPLYQSERFIAATLASVLAQTVSDIEVIVIDDGSRDGGPDLARAAGDARVTVLVQANAGVSAARNHGLRGAIAPVIAFIDADDLWEPTKLERHLAHLEARCDLGVSYSASRLIDETDLPKGVLGVPGGDTTADQLVLDNPLGSGSTPVMRRAALDAIEYSDAAGRRCWFDEALRQSEDVDCWVRIAVSTSWRFAALPEPLTIYRLNAAGLSADVRRQLATWLEFRAKLARSAPDLERRVGNRAEARQRRYLARKSVRNGEPAFAARLLARAFWLDPMMLVRDPRETIMTTGATLSALLLPNDVRLRVMAWLRTPRTAGSPS